MLILVSVFLWFGFDTKSKATFYTSICLYILIFLFQYKNSFVAPLTNLDTNEKLTQEIRLNAYPPFPITLGEKTIYIPIANWFEQRKETISVYKIGKNFSEIIDPNLYFFTNHPREKTGAKEFEKFSYILLPVFILGLFEIKKRQIKYIFLTISPIILISIIGNNSPIGPFSLFPFFALIISLGFKKITSSRKFLIFKLILFLLVFIQTITYAY